MPRGNVNSAMTNRERILATLAGEIVDYVPGWIHAFFNAATVQRLLPAELWADEYHRFVGDAQTAFAPFEERTLDRMIAFNRYTDRPMIGLGRGGHISGHGGPGEFLGVVVEETAGYQIIEFETGARAKLQFAPHFYHPFDMPVKSVADLEAMELPDPEDPVRWRGIGQDVAYLKARGEYTLGYLNGFFSACHYYFCDYQEFMMALILDQELVEQLMLRLGDWNLRAARMLCESGVDCIVLSDDLGSEGSLLFDPRLYDRFFFPWHRALCDLAHGCGVHVHLHSHGNILPLMDRLVETGIDMLNPLDQTEGMDLALLKERYGKRLTLLGGLDRFVYDRELPEIERQIRRAIEIGSPGGRFVLVDPGGVPENITSEKFNAYLEISRRVRGQIN
jgi:uroporphyrinogen-III decarboxylase